ncbi:LysR family transcriptional regulator [Trichlorobacter lovleyi]|uniref:LysR family transcriptional regulator n=1 Tax=Trichlorobacter lovleyi TaxID=313985 RepID=UPI0024817B19|nr:LysR family transcriptional regulator [Trichlorobacter lovleyi]
MELVYLRTFVESLEAGSFSKAADTLCVTQSAVSRRIKFLEDQYGYPLLDRSGPVLVATEAGKIVLDKARQLLSIEDELLKGLKGIGKRDGLSFCCTPGFGTAFLPRVVRELLQTSSEMHNMQFFLDMPDQVLAGVQDGRFDIGLLEHCEQFDFSELQVLQLPDDDVLFVSAPALDIPSGEVTVAQLGQHTLFSRRAECCSTKFLSFNLKKIGLDETAFPSRVVYDDLHQIISSTVDGLGVAFTARSLVADQIAAGKLRSHQVHGFMHTRKRSLVFRPCFVSNPLADLLIQEVQRCFE